MGAKDASVWNDIIIYARSALVRTAENNFTIIQANAFWSDDKKSKKFFFTRRNNNRLDSRIRNNEKSNGRYNTCHYK